jgi:hypothetical protein
MADQEWHQWQPAPRQPYPAYGAYGAPRPEYDRPRIQEDTLKEVFFQCERKSYLITLKQNPRGAFLRITEGASGRRNAIIIPSTGLKEFQKLLGEMVKASETLPSLPPAPPSQPPV